MGLRPFLSSCFLIALLLVACKTKEAIVASTAVPAHPVDTATPFPTRTPTPTNTPVETTVTSNPLPLTPTPTPSATSIWNFVTRGPLPTVSLLDRTSSYTLTTPSPEDIFQAFRQTAHAVDLYFSVYPLQNADPYFYINQLLEADLNEFYPDEIPDVAFALNDASLMVHNFGWWGSASNAHLRILEESILQYLNQYQPAFLSGQTIEEETFRMLPVRVEFGNDKPLYWVLQVDAFIYHARIFLLLEQAEENGRFTQVGERLTVLTSRYFSEGSSDIYVQHDVTGDGINEVIIESWAYFSGTGSEITVDVFSWDGSSLNRLHQIVDFEPDIEFKDYDNDGIVDIQVTQNYYGNFGCEWQDVDTYSWPGQKAQFVDQDGSSPDTAVCNLWRATLPFNYVHTPAPDERISLMKRAINQLREEQLNSDDLLAYALSQLAVAYAKQGLYQQARDALDEVYSLPESSRYSQFIQENDATANKSILGLCRNLVINAERVFDTDMGEYLNEGAVLGRGGDWNRPHQRMICDLKSIVSFRLQNVSLPSDQTPVEMLTTLDMSLGFAQSANLDDDSDLEWIGILEPEAPWLVIFDAANGEWKTHFIDDLFYTPILGFEFEQRDLSNDGKPDIIVSLAENTTSNLAASRFYEIIFIEIAEEGRFTAVTSKYVDDDVPDLSEIDRAFFNLDQPVTTTAGWKRLEGFSTEEVSFTSTIRALTDAVLDQTAPIAATKITELLAYLPTNDPEAQLFIEHLTYLLGYYYELSDDEEQAVSTYLDLIQRYPNSPWSWLAWARLKPVEQ